MPARSTIDKLPFLVRPCGRTSREDKHRATGTAARGTRSLYTGAIRVIFASPARGGGGGRSTYACNTRIMGAALGFTTGDKNPRKVARV